MGNFPILTYLLLATIVVTFVNFYFWFRANKTKAFNWLIFFLNIYLFVHAIFVFTVRFFFPEHIYFNTVAPFVMLYGPLLYIAIAFIRQNHIAKSKLYLHLIIPALFWLTCLVLLCFYKEGEGFYNTYLIFLAIATPVSLIGYAGYGIVAVMSTDASLKRYKLMVMPATLLLIFMSIISIIVPIYSTELASNPDATDLISMMIYSLMFATSVLVFKYKTSIIFSEDHLKSKSLVAPSKIQATPTKYERSTLTTTQLKEYEERLKAYMVKQEPYLESSLSLAQLAKLLKMPSHHLTQVLSMCLNQSFYSYVNSFRIEYAVMLLNKNTTMSMTSLAIASGFSSKVSFYRQFKSFKGCTPAEYKAKK